MDLFNGLLVVHIAAAATWFGANIIQAVVPPRMAAHGAQASAAWYRTAGALSRNLYMPAAIVLLITGSWMILINDSYSFGSLFVTIGFAMIVIGAILGIMIFGPQSAAAADAIEAGDDSAAARAKSKVTGWGIVDTLLLLFTITAMVYNWN